ALVVRSADTGEPIRWEPTRPSGRCRPREPKLCGGLIRPQHGADASSTQEGRHAHSNLEVISHYLDLRWAVIGKDSPIRIGHDDGLTIEFDRTVRQDSAPFLLV